MKRLFTLFCWCAPFVFALPACFAAEPDAKGFEFFEKNVRPLLVDRCFDCHNVDNAESKLRLDTLSGMLKGGERGPAIIPGNSKKSLLIIAVNHGEVLQMPPKEKLSVKQIADLSAWVKMGAPWPNSKPATVNSFNDDKGPQFTQEQKSFWAFQRPVESKLPNVKNQPWVKSPIDRFVLAELEAAGMKPATPADKRILIRRATFDLTGLPPTLEEINKFLVDDSPEAFAHVVDRLLASPRYGERWGRHWLDVVRYADSNGLDENLAYANAFRYRDYVIRAFNNDKPFDRFVQEQIAGDLLPASENEPDTEHHERLIATAFLSLGPKMLAEDDPMKMEMDIIDEQVDTVCRAFMGLTMGCARCHDHKFDPITAADYYALAGIFKSTKTMENHRVVAVWHEYTIASKKVQAIFKAHEQSIKEKETQLKKRIASAQQEFLEGERRKAGQYIRAAAEFIQFGGPVIADGTSSVGELIAEKSPAVGTILREAEMFDRGTLQIDTAKWGKGVGVLLQSGFAEYDIEIPSAGRYQLELRYAAEQSRPVQISLNGTVVKKDAASEVTGGWYADSQEWYLEGVYDFQAGKNVIRLERGNAVPHIDKLLLVRLPETTALKDLKTVMKLGSEKNPPGTIIVEAENFNRGTIKKRPPVILNGGDGNFFNEAAYVVEIPADGNYQLEFLYACAGGRKFRLSINGQLVNENSANQGTGGFNNNQVKWFAEAIVNLQKGRATIHIEETGPTPHLDKFALVPTSRIPTVVLRTLKKGSQTEQQLAQELQLNQRILKQWIRYLQNANRGAKTIWQPIAEAKGTLSEAIVNRYQQQFDRASTDWKQLRASKEGAKAQKLPNTELDPYRVVLYATSGPYRLPQKPERYYTEVAKTDIKKLEAKKKELAKNKPELPRTMGVREGKVMNLKIHLRGSHITLGREVPRQFLQIIEGDNQTPVDQSQSGRLQLARWLTAPQHPLTARVMVNRIWQWHFGTGLVRTPDNFGRLGQRPTNQPLLDWLAVQFVKNNWSTKEMHRLMMLSNTYRMSTQYNAKAIAADPHNRLYWRFNRRRMAAEEVRDSILAMGGDFDFSIGGQLMKDKNRAYVTGTGSKVTQYDVNRRSVYLPILRSALYQVLQAFDFADPSVLTGQRQSTTVAPQALFMMNSDLVAKNAGLMARGLLENLNLNDEARLRIAFERAYSRLPDKEELDRFLKFVQKIEEEYQQTGMTSDESRQKAWRSLCRVLIASNEFVYIE